MRSRLPVSRLLSLYSTRLLSREWYIAQEGTRQISCCVFRWVEWALVSGNLTCFGITNVPSRVILDGIAPLYAFFVCSRAKDLNLSHVAFVKCRTLCPLFEGIGGVVSTVKSSPTSTSRSTNVATKIPLALGGLQRLVIPQELLSFVWACYFCSTFTTTVVLKLCDA
jgi:hypothetical protein